MSLSYILRVRDQVSVGGWLRKRCLNMLMYAADTTTPVVVIPGLILGLRPASARRRYFVTTSLIGWAKARISPVFIRKSVLPMQT